MQKRLIRRGIGRSQITDPRYFRLLRLGCQAKRKAYSAKSKDSDFVLHVFTALSTRRSSLAFFSSNNLIRSRQHVRRNREADLLRRLEVNDQLELCRLLHREIGWLSTF